MIDDALLSRFLEEYPFQPATAIWRAVELPQLAQYPIPAGRGLDLGCGDGRLTRLLLETWGHRPLVGVDIDAEETALAVLEGIYDRVHTCPADAIPERDALFNFVFSNSVLEHIPDLDPVLAEIARLLVAGGLALWTVPGPGFHAVLRGPLLPWTSRDDYLQSVDSRLAHRRYLSTDEWRRRLSDFGFDVLESRPYLAKAETRRWESVSRVTAGVLVSASAVARHRRQPIEIQRALGLRRAGLRMPSLLAWTIARLLRLGLSNATEPVEEDEAGCLLIVARRRESAQDLQPIG